MTIVIKYLPRKSGLLVKKLSCVALIKSAVVFASNGRWKTLYCIILYSINSLHCAIYNCSIHYTLVSQVPKVVLCKDPLKYYAVHTYMFFISDNKLEESVGCFLSSIFFFQEGSPLENGQFFLLWCCIWEWWVCVYCGLVSSLRGRRHLCAFFPQAEPRGSTHPEAARTALQPWGCFHFCTWKLSKRLGGCVCKSLKLPIPRRIMDLDKKDIHRRRRRRRRRRLLRSSIYLEKSD